MQQTATAGLVAVLLALWPADNRVVLTAGRAAPRPDPRPAGQLLLAEYQCGACHRIDGVSGATGQRGPTLVAFGSRSYIAGRVPNTEPLLARWIADPQALVPGTAMPSLSVPPERARLMALYLQRPR